MVGGFFPSGLACGFRVRGVRPTHEQTGTRRWTPAVTEEERPGRPGTECGGRSRRKARRARLPPLLSPPKKRLSDGPSVRPSVAVRGKKIPNPKLEKKPSMEFPETPREIAVVFSKEKVSQKQTHWACTIWRALA
ncbi:MAG: hypothetical protein BJ554DRAFT_4992 [Olpidium bornovanus]|uniref:Uncharacterized protein n=1 Tax=Olpidium bornovanus TaxID=278681 RepID=A0A8H8DDX8_9FUNG|nr:MAG: hypothetical protein BJ554DRAFT_4992 [Olpidium bornovanus]